MAREPLVLDADSCVGLQCAHAQLDDTVVWGVVVGPLPKLLAEIEAL